MKLNKKLLPKKKRVKGVVLLENKKRTSCKVVILLKNDELVKVAADLDTDTGCQLILKIFKHYNIEPENLLKPMSTSYVKAVN